MQLSEIGTVVRSRREQLGLSQGQFARFSGLSRVTINQLERGTLKDLGVAKLMTLGGVLGIRLTAATTRGRVNGLYMASITSGVSLREKIDARQLSKALGSGVIPTGYRPQIAVLLNEAPLEILVKAVEEAAKREAVAPKKVWAHLRAWARDLMSTRRELTA